MQQTLDEILRGGGQALVLLFVAGIRRISLVSSAFSRRAFLRGPRDVPREDILENLNRRRGVKRRNADE